MLLHWQPAFSTSAFHAAHAIVSGVPVVDAQRLEPLRRPTQALAEMIQTHGLSAPLLWRHLLGLSASLASNRELATTALRKTLGSHDPRFQALVSVFLEIIDALERTHAQVFPNLQEELTRRRGPIKEQWEARGPGLLNTLGQLTDDDLLVEEATVLLVQPVQGGGGGAHLQYNAVRVEAVLANPQQTLPEAVRLAWLLAQLNCDLPKYSETIPADRLEIVAALALLPVTLAGAQEVEWVQFDAQTLTLALTNWQVPWSTSSDDANDMSSVVDSLLQWWTTYQAARPRWAVALAALDRMLPA